MTDPSANQGLHLNRGASLIGALLILAPWQNVTSDQLLGGLLSLVASASYGASYVYIGHYLNDTGLSPIVLSVSQLAVATGLLTITLPSGTLVPSELRPDAIAALLILGFVGTGAAYVLNYRIIADDGPVVASTITYLLPVVALALGALPSLSGWCETPRRSGLARRA